MTTKVDKNYNFLLDRRLSFGYNTPKVVLHDPRGIILEIREAMMKKRVFSIMGLSFLLAAFALAAVPAQAQNVEQKIQALEQELSQLKADQLELRKDATAAAAALPNFSYDAGNGVRIEAADKAWALQLSHEIDWLMPFESGSSHQNRTWGQVMTRRDERQLSTRSRTVNTAPPALPLAATISPP